MNDKLQARQVAALESIANELEKFNINFVEWAKDNLENSRGLERSIYSVDGAIDNIAASIIQKSSN